jgi:hypothetical protein
VSTRDEGVDVQGQRPASSARQLLTTPRGRQSPTNACIQVYHITMQYMRTPRESKTMGRGATMTRCKQREDMRRHVALRACTSPPHALTRQCGSEGAPVCGSVVSRALTFVSAFVM